MAKRIVVLLLTTEGVSTHIGGLGTFIKEIQAHFQHDDRYKLHVHEIALDRAYLMKEYHDPYLTRLIASSDLIHANDYFTSYIAMLHNPGARVITSVHMLHRSFGYLTQPGTTWLESHKEQQIENYVLRKSSALIAVSDFVRSQILDLQLKLSGPIYVLHNGAGEQFFRYEASKRSSSLSLGICGRLVAQKGSDRIPDLIRALYSANFDGTLTVVGEGPYYEPIFRCIDELNLGSRCTLTGWKENSELPQMYAGWDATLSFTEYEPFGIAPLESIATGTPVVGNIVGGMREFCMEGTNSFGINLKRLSPNIGSLLEILKALPVLNRDHVRSSVKLFTWERVAACLRDLYALHVEAST